MLCPCVCLLLLRVSEGKAYLAANAEKPGVQVLKSGLQFKVLQQAGGAGGHPTRSDTVRVHYRGTTIDGKEFDSSYARGQPAVSPHKAAATEMEQRGRKSMLLTRRCTLAPSHRLSVWLPVLHADCVAATQTFGVTQVIKGWTEILQVRRTKVSAFLSEFVSHFSF